MSGTTVYAGGLFGTAGGHLRSHLAALDTTTGAATAWNPSPDGWVNAIAVSASTVQVGGAFLTAANQPLSGFARLAR